MKELDITQLWVWSMRPTYMPDAFNHFCMVRRMVGYKYQIILWQHSTKYKYIAKHDIHHEAV